MGNIGGILSGPVYVDYVEDNGKYYGFVTDNYVAKLYRLDFGVSLLNTPSITDLGNLGVIPRQTEGLQVIKNEGKWYAIIVGGDPQAGIVSSIVKIEFGANITNNSPAGTNWGNIGNMSYPHDLYVFAEAGKWFGFTVNTSNSTITRFDFTNSFSNIPTAVNLGNVGNLNSPTGVHAVKDNSAWHVFVTNASNSTLSRLDFGNSLLNTPTGVNLGNIGGVFHTCWDIFMMKFCGNILGYVINGDGSYGDLIKLDFNNNLRSVPSAVSFGNIGNLSFPHCLSKVFRAGSDLYTFIPNVANKTISRLRFPGCTNSNIPNSNLRNPPPVVYNTPGVYNINLTTDEGLATQSSFCKQVVVVAPPAVNLGNDTSICASDIMVLDAGNPGATYLWQNGSTTQKINVTNGGTYYVSITKNGCVSSDTIRVDVINCQPAVVASFTAPDTVCVNDPVTITNTSAGATNYFWNFCVADISVPPTGVNLGNVGQNFSQPVFMDYTYFNGNYYGFLINHNPGELIRLDFGNSLLNSPTSRRLGNFGGIIPSGSGSEGIQIVNNEGKWYAIIVGGYPPTGSIPRILKIDFGSNLTNLNPVATNWGNIGNMLQPIDLHVFKEGNNWYGFTVNAESNSVTRFNFTNSFNNVPTAQNLGNIGNLSYPTGIYAINDNGFWRVFITNGIEPSSLTRLDFGSSLLNTPTGVNLGNAGNMLQRPRDLTIMKSCNQVIGFAVNGNSAYNDIVKIDFNNNLSGTPTISSIGNIGNLNFPHSISKLFRVGADLYSFVTNVNNNTLTRLKFQGCTNSNIPNSNAQNPPSVTYNLPGTYNINLTVDEGLPTQSAFCKNVVVMPALEHHPAKSFTICEGDSVLLSSAYPLKNQWSTGSAANSVYVNSGGTYWVRTTNGFCSNTDSFIVKIVEAPFRVNLGNDTSICKGDSIILDAGNAGSTYTWQNGLTTQRFTVTLPGDYRVSVKKNGCVSKDTIVIGQLASPIIELTNDTSICQQASVILNAKGGISYKWYPDTGLSNLANSSTIASPVSTTTYYVNVTGSNKCVSKDSVTITVIPKPVFTASSATLVVCNGDSTTLIASGGDIYKWEPASSLSNPNNATTQAYPVATTRYKVEIVNRTCNITDSVFLNLRVADKPAHTISKSNDIDCVLGQATLTATGGVKYLWTPATGLSNPAISSPVATINNTTTYSVAITSTNGCVVKDSIQVNVLSGSIQNGYLVPNSFTPNNDGVNDCFNLRHWGAMKEFSLLIYNRWGQTVFSTNNTNACWNGRYKDVEQPSGAYVYYITAKTFCGDVVRKGTILLIR